MELIDLEKLNYLKLLSIYLIGVLSIFTPCVYPILPVTIALFAKASNKQVSVLSRALVYILGLVSMYVLLGIISATTGKIFGSFLENSLLTASLALLFLLIALSTFEIINLGIADKVQRLAPSSSSNSPLGLFILGMASGLLAAPCTGPVLVSILLLVAKEQSFSLGVAYLLAYSLGIGTVFFILALSSSYISSLPKLKNWLYHIKTLLGIAILFSAFYLLDLSFALADYFFLIPSSLSPVLIFLSLICFLLSIRSKTKGARFACAMLVAFLSFVNYSNYNTKTGHSFQVSQDWIKEANTCYEEIAKSPSISIVDIRADWCLVCTELEQRTFSHPEVTPLLASHVKCRLDYDTVPDLIKKYNLTGLPTVLFLNSNMEELKEYRISKFIDHKNFIKHLEKLNKAL